MVTIKDIFDYVAHDLIIVNGTRFDHCKWYTVSCIEDCPYKTACNIPAVLTACDMILATGEYH